MLAREASEREDLHQSKNNAYYRRNRFDIKHRSEIYLLNLTKLLYQSHVLQVLPLQAQPQQTLIRLRSSLAILYLKLPMRIIRLFLQFNH